MVNMEELLREMESMKITGNSASAHLWKKCVDIFVPQLMSGVDLPGVEDDFKDYRGILNDRLKEIWEIFHRIFLDSNEGANDPEVMRIIVIHLIVVVGEQSERCPWNTDETSGLVQSILTDICALFGNNSLSSIFCGPDDKLQTILMILRPKLMKDTWKTYPGAVVCYKWLLNQIEIPELTKYLSNILPTALIIFDDFVPENRIIGLECIYRIIQHSSTHREFIENGYAAVIYDAVEKLTHHRDVRYIIPTFTCITSVLAVIENNNHSINRFEWSKRDDVIATILDNMEMEQDLDLRHAYMMSLPQLLTDLGCAKWLQRLIRIIEEYCSHHTDLRTLKATLQTAEVILTLFHLRIPAHCTPLYTAFLKLHLDLTETPIFDKEITNSLERCIYTLYQLTPNVGSVIMRDDRIRTIIEDSLLFACTGDTKYCN
ncbi:TELO2-interacting protein 2 [Fopius arisanus]|uniref:TELO2-interacting protein 2 n=2 Tax=Fopius arisanus TaxID=64838 RepID=A0A9R1T353_9HYME|nr:PREDICTED: TELO2-interacting protein 2-like [Fopius arisanus]